MAKIENTLLTAAAIFLFALSGAASADRGYHGHHHGGGRVHFGLSLGVPLAYPWPGYYPYPAYAYPPYPPAVVVRPAPRVYVERDDQAFLESPPPEQFWYFCRDSETYYPYVKECASPWERVPARPAAPR